MLAVVLCGCAPVMNATLREMERSRQTSLAKIAPLDAVELEVFLIERPSGDPMTGNVLWQELDQISSVDPVTRDRLRSNGLRFGIAGTSLPYALSGLTSTPHDQGAGDRTNRQVYTAPSGAAHEFSCGELPSPVIIRHSTPGGMRPQEYLTAKGLFRCRVARSQPGWVELDVVPEIHHGVRKLRPEANDVSWSFVGGQEVEALYGERFRVGLNIGESLVLGPVRDKPETVGDRFFRIDSRGAPLEKLIVIRVRSTEQVAADSARGG
ncbi:MAG: hypothetical protein ACK5Q5_23005 [Planctomycetaceae bacterium]